MKINFKLLLITIILPSLSQASLTISKQYSFSPDTLNALESTLVQLSEREYIEYPTGAPVPDQDGIFLWCPANTPNEELEGCELKFTIKLPDEASLNITKKLNLENIPSEVSSRLKTVPPNSTQDHQHFGSLFGSDDNSGSHYFCQPEGEESSKVWSCYLYINEQL